MSTWRRRKAATAPELAVGTLIINLTDPATRQLLFSVRLDRPIDWNPATYQATVDAAVAAMFEKYPFRQSADDPSRPAVTLREPEAWPEASAYTAEPSRARAPTLQ